MTSTLRFNTSPAEKRKAEECYFFSSFFLTQLVHHGLLAAAVPDDDSDEGWNRNFRRGFNRVRKWTKYINIFDKKFLFIPVNNNAHWSMVVVCNPGNIEMTNHDDEIDNNVKQDNVGGNHHWNTGGETECGGDVKERSPKENKDKRKGKKPSPLKRSQTGVGFEEGHFERDDLYAMDEMNDPRRSAACSGKTEEVIECDSRHLELVDEPELSVSDVLETELASRSEHDSKRSNEEKRETSSICDETAVVDDEDKEIPAFVCMDSLKCHPLKKICKILRKYLEEEWKCQKARHEMKKAELVNAGEGEKLRLVGQIQLKKTHPLFKKGTIPVRVTARNFPDVHPKVPTQENSCDCGVFLLKYAAWFFEEYIKGRPIRITQKSVAKQLKGVVNTNMFRYSIAKASSKCIKIIPHSLKNHQLSAFLTQFVLPSLSLDDISAKRKEMESLLRYSKSFPNNDMVFVLLFCFG
jgi:Ulp1 family protease